MKNFNICLLINYVVEFSASIVPDWTLDIDAVNVALFSNIIASEKWAE